MTFHGGLKGTHRIDFGDDDLSTHAAECGSATLAHVAITADDTDLASDHDVGGALDSVQEGFAAAVEVVELRLGNAVVDVDGGEQELASLGHFIEAMHAGGGLFRDALEVLHDGVEDAGLVLGDLLEQVLDDLHFVIVGRGLDPLVAVFHFVALVDEKGDVATIIDDELWSEFTWEDDGLPGAPPVFFEGLAFPCEDGRTGSRNACGGVVLGGEDVARSPAHVGTEFLQRLDEHAGLNRHVQGARDADACEGLARAVFFARGHQAGHFAFRDVEFLTTEVGEGDVFNFVVAHGVV